MIYELDIVLNAYRLGLFPMAKSADDVEFSWYEAPMRGLLPMQLHVPRRLRATIQAARFTVTVDQDFTGVINGCAAWRPKRTGTWINRGIRDLFVDLHTAGYAHSVECWRDGDLVGGIYGLSIGGLFCAESMFSIARDASKVALVQLAALLHSGEFTVFDTQLINPHLEQFGAYEVSREEYLALLEQAVRVPAVFDAHADVEAVMRDYLNTLSSGSALR